MKMIAALMTLKVTPAAMTAIRIGTGFLAKDRGSAFCLTGPVSSWPSSLT